MEQVTDGLSNPLLIACIIALASIVGFLARTIFKMQEDRRKDDLASQKEILAAMQASTAAMNTLIDKSAR